MPNDGISYTPDAEDLKIATFVGESAAVLGVTAQQDIVANLGVGADAPFDPDNPRVAVDQIAALSSSTSDAEANFKPAGDAPGVA